MDAETARCDWGGCDLCAFARERPSRVRRDIYSETLCIYSLAYAVRVHANDVASRCDAVGTFAIHHHHRKHPKHEPNNPSNKHRHRHRHQSINPCAPRHRWRAESHTYIPHTSPSYSSAIAIAIPHPSIHRRRRPHSRVLSQKPSIHRSRVLLFRRRRPDDDEALATPHRRRMRKQCDTTTTTTAGERSFAFWRQIFAVWRPTDRPSDRRACGSRARATMMGVFWRTIRKMWWWCVLFLYCFILRVRDMECFRVTLWESWHGVGVR